MAFRRKQRPPDEYPTSVRLGKDLREFLIDEAQKHDRSLTWVISDVLESWKAYQIKAREKTPRELRIRK